MFRTIFQKQLILHLGTLIISFVFLGAVLSQVIRGYITSQRVAFLQQSGGVLAQQIGHYLMLMYGVIDNETITLQMSLAPRYLNASLIILDAEMNLMAHSADLSISQDTAFNMNELAPLRQGRVVVTQGKLNGIFSGSQIIVGYPVKINNAVVASILLNSSLADLNKTIWDMYGAAGICLVIAGGVGFILIYISSRTISKPLRQMNNAAKLIASGDFEKRVTVSGRDEVSELADSLNNMAESLDQQEKNRRDFIANISHDLRSPLTSMRGFIEAVMDGTIPPEKTHHYLSIVLDETERLTKLTNDIVDLSQIQAMQIALEKKIFDVNGLIRGVASHFERRVKEKKLQLLLKFADEDNPVEADQEKIQRVVYNLLDNAVKFTPEEGRIEIETSVGEGKVWITVKDNGRGIRAEDQKKIFERFFKADASRGEDKKGSGLGLSIVREFVKAHGETVTLQSEEGGGAAFTFGLAAAGR
ncbi:MAG: cell wall metabolism sensor histidine kinase WalK [Clostridiales bacterium]|jgi:signal transduction histidine kinase|nr:cell wall metabolism sensor histidine kinase WalK [Clostridiales bacterium]